MKNLFLSLRRFYQNVSSHDIFTRSAALAYYLLFAIFPSLLFLYSLLGLFNIDWLNLITSVKKFIPNDVYEILFTYAEYLTPKKDFTFLLSGLITAVYSSYRAVKCIRLGLNIAFASRGKRTTFQEFIRSLLFTLIFYFAIFVCLLVMPIASGVFEIFSNYFIISNKVLAVWNGIKNVMAVIPFLLSLSTLYYISPGSKIPFSTVLPGAIFSTAGISLSASIFNLFTINAFRYSTTYGSLAIVVVFVLWLYAISFIILLGGEISAVLWYTKENRKN